MISYAQNFEDVMLWRALGHIENGFYVDIGAQDPVVDSVSLGFYEHGWRGVHVEPTSAYAEALRAARPDETVVQAAIGDDVGLIPFFEIAGTGISTGDAGIAEQHATRGYANKRIDVPCIRLSALFDHIGRRDIHWMKIDVEGMELAVLRSWAPSQVRPWIVIVESTLPLSTELSHAAWEPVVLELGYDFAYFDGLNRFYVSRQHRGLTETFMSPPNVFDQFVIAGSSSHTFCAKLNGDIRQARDELEAVKGRSDELEQQVQAGRHTEVVEARVLELEHRLTEQQAVAAALAQVDRAKDETLQLLKTISASQESRAAQVAAAQEQALRLQGALIEREGLLAETRSQLATAQASLAQHYAEQTRLQEEARTRLAEREQAFAVERTGWIEAHRREAQVEFEARLVEQDQRHRQVLASAEASASRFQARLAEQRLGFDAESAAFRSARDAQLLQVQRDTQARLADQEQGFRHLLGRAQEEAARARSGLEQQTRSFDLKLAQAEADAARLRADLAEERRASSAAVEDGRRRAHDLEASLAEQELGFQRHIANAQSEAAQLQSRLLDRQREFAVQLDAAVQASRASETVTLQREMQSRLEEQAGAFLQQLTDQRVTFGTELAAAEQRHSGSLELQLEMQRQLSAARDDSTQLRARLTALQQSVAAEFSVLRRKPLARLREALARSAAVPTSPTPSPARSEPFHAFAADPGAAPLAAMLDALGETTPASLRSIDSIADADPELRYHHRNTSDVLDLLQEPHAEIHVLNDLLVLNGVSFVRAAYRTVLKREADPEGERNYAGLLRAGLDKIVLLRDMSRSIEGREAGVVLPGLARALRRRRLASIPLVGPLLLGMGAPFRRSGDRDPTRAFQSQLIDMQRSTLELSYQQRSELQHAVQQLRLEQSQVEQMVRRFGDGQDAAGRSLTAKTETSIEKLEQQQSRLEQALGTLAARQDDLVASFTKPLSEFAARVEASVAELRQQQERLEEAVRQLGDRQEAAVPDVQALLLKKAAAWKA